MHPCALFGLTGAQRLRCSPLKWVAIGDVHTCNTYAPARLCAILHVVVVVVHDIESGSIDILFKRIINSTSTNGASIVCLRDAVCMLLCLRMLIEELLDIFSRV